MKGAMVEMVSSATKTRETAIPERMLTICHRVANLKMQTVRVAPTRTIKGPTTQTIPIAAAKVTKMVVAPMDRPGTTKQMALEIVKVGPEITTERTRAKARVHSKTVKALVRRTRIVLT